MNRKIKDSVILVDEQDFEYGVMEKYEAHQKGKLHRAFSIFIVNDAHQVLLQKRASTKYHSAGLWSNTCCSHPRSGEDLYSAARRRLMEEMGFDCNVTEQFSLIYKTNLDAQMVENEFDHVFTGKYNKDPKPDPAEVAEWKWMDISKVSKDLDINRQAYSYWFYLIWQRLIKEGLF